MQASANLAALSCLIQAATAAGRSERYINKLWKLYFAAEDTLKSFGNGSML